MNKIYFGDNLSILKTLQSESIDLIYIDPPFNTGKKQVRKTIKTVKSQKGDRKGFQGNKYKTIELDTKSYKDSFNHDHKGLIRESLDKSYELLEPYASVYFLEEFLRPRLEEAYRLLKPKGSLYFHIDYREVHYCKVLLDSIFGRDCFLNEIIWAYDFGGRAKSKWPAKHDNILLYVKDKRKFIYHTDEVKTEPYMAPGLVGPEKAKNGKNPTDTWYWEFVGTKGMKNSDTWWMSIVGTNSKERIGYPTQKPIRLINRMIQASSFPEDIVLDFFAGSGTVGESCLLNNRRFLLIDNNKQSLEVMARRFNGIENIEWLDYDPKEIQKQSPIREDLIKKTSEDSKNIYSDEIKKLVVLSKNLEMNIEKKNDYWKNSPFEWIVRLPARSKGKYAREIIIEWLREEGLEIEKEKSTSEEIIHFRGKRIAVKYSSLWTDGGFYRFQQIRADGPEFIFCLGISYSNVDCWIIEKELAIQYGAKQHRGASSSEYWLQINPTDLPDWLKNKGGDLKELKKRFLEIGDS